MEKNENISYKICDINPQTLCSLCFSGLFSRKLHSKQRYYFQENSSKTLLTILTSISRSFRSIYHRSLYRVKSWQHDFDSLLLKPFTHCFSLYSFIFSRFRSRDPKHPYPVFQFSPEALLSYDDFNVDFFHAIFHQINIFHGYYGFPVFNHDTFVAKYNISFLAFKGPNQSLSIGFLYQ